MHGSLVCTCLTALLLSIHSFMAGSRRDAGVDEGERGVYMYRGLQYMRGKRLMDGQWDADGRAGGRDGYTLESEEHRG